MARVNDFRDFDAFKACRAFVRETGLLVRTPSFAPNRNLANQMERASISVLSNFAEGYERAQLIYSLDVGLVPQSRYEELDIMGVSAGRLLGGLSRYLAGSEKRGRKYDRRPKTANKR
jgi:hypothetical protein